MERPENWLRGHSVTPPWPGPAWPPRAQLEAQAPPPYHRLSAGSQLRHQPGPCPTVATSAGCPPGSLTPLLSCCLAWLPGQRPTQVLPPLRLEKPQP